MMTIKNAKNLILFLTIALATFSLQAQTVNIKIIETSDVHGALLPYDLTNDTSTTASLAHVHAYVVSQKRQRDQEIILLDNGDLIQGDPMSYYYNFVNTKGTHIFADALNFMGYDAATIGNHDIEAGHEVYDKFRREIKFPWLAANVINTETNEPYFEPYTIIERKGVRIAVLGVTTPGVPNWLPEKLWSGMIFDDMIESAEKWVEIIKEKEKPDLLIGLFHSGVDYTYGGVTADTYKNENASQLIAESVPGFDVIFVGHDHAGWNYFVKNSLGEDVLILGPLSKAKTVAVANISMEFNNKSEAWEKKEVSGEIVEMKGLRPDETFVLNYLMPLNQVKDYVNKPLGQISKTISSRESIFGVSEFVDLVHTIQLETTGADVSFTAPLTFNSSINEGWIYIKDIFRIYHYENFLYTMSLSGKEIKNYLEYSYGRWFNQMKDENDHLLLFTKDENGKIKFSTRYNTPETEERFYNFSSAAGINYNVDVSKPAGDRIQITSLSNSSVFHLDSTYSVAINSYRGSGGGGHITIGAGIPQEELPQRIISSTEKDFRYHIIDWIVRKDSFGEEKKTIDPEIISTWKVVPDEWWQKGRAKDYELLFGTKAPHAAEPIESEY
ncbi:MAG TPA: bifunctional UDP-sugar hydrolase/5'-nucleotidase [Ignavibacteriaceae bacterium]|nr:bifunctional UDP-sugar hydrolase/5'-nucleotidase [Ignavibacteriaceae bacterium]